MSREKVKNFEENKEIISLATEGDIPNIIKLQRDNLPINLAEEEKRKEGFVSLTTTEQDLEKIMKGDGVIVVDKQNNNLNGYLFSITLDYAKKISFFDPLIENISNMEYKGKNLNEYKYCILAQTAIEKESRGKGILEKLYAKLKVELINKGYELGVSEITENNEKSLGVHINKIGLKKLGVYNFNNKNWIVVALDLKELRQ
jgi:hypothetical protein